MLEQIIEPTLLTQFKEALENSGNVVVTCHKSPDGDAAGSNLALKLILDKLGKKATVVTPDNVPEDMAFLPGYNNIVSFAKDPEMAAETINAADLICCLDFNGLSRLADMRELVANAKCNKAMVDHHINPEPICNPILSYPQMTSTCELLYRILVAIGYSDMIDLDVATCIYTGMMTDTGNFSYNSNHAEPVYNRCRPRATRRRQGPHLQTYSRHEQRGAHASKLLCHSRKNAFVPVPQGFADNSRQARPAKVQLSSGRHGGSRQHAACHPYGGMVGFLPRGAWFCESVDAVGRRLPRKHSLRQILQRRRTRQCRRRRIPRPAERCYRHVPPNFERFN